MRKLLIVTFLLWILTLANEAGANSCVDAFGVKARAEKVDRQAYFETAFDRLGRVLQLASESQPSLNLTSGEALMLKEMRAFVERNTNATDYDFNYTAGLVFLDRSGDFDLENGQPTRTAKTTANVADPIAVNLSLISMPENTFSIVEAIQLLIHEIGHKAPNKVQNDVDSLAAKIAVLLQTHLRKIELGNETSLEVLSIPNRQVDLYSGELSRPGLIVLLKYPRGVVDITTPVVEAVKPSATVVLKRPFYGQQPDYTEDPFRILNQFVWKNEFVRASGETNLMTVRATISREANAVRAKAWMDPQMNRIAQPERDVQDLEIQIRTGDEPAVISATRRLHYPKLERNSEIVLETEWKDSRTLRVEARGFGDLKIRGLLLRTDESEFEVALQPAVGEGKAGFLIAIPEKTSQRFLKASSIVLEDGTRVPAANVVKVDFTDNQVNQTRASKKLLKARIKTESGWKTIYKEKRNGKKKKDDLIIDDESEEGPTVARGKNRVEFVIQTDRALKEVRLRVENTLYQFDDMAFPHRAEMQPDPGMSSRGFMPDFRSPRYQTDVVSWIVLREGEFTQTRDGKFVVIEADLDLVIRHRKESETATFRQTMGAGRYFNNRVRFDRYVGWDYGQREISGIELIDDSYATTLIQPSRSINFTVENGSIDTDAKKAKEWSERRKHYDWDLLKDSGWM